MTETTLIGRKLLDPEGGMIGTIDDVLVDPRTLVREWVRVRFGILRDRTLVPMADICSHPSAPATCALSKRQVRDAPSVHDHTLDATTRTELLRYYGLDEPA
jgi:hypothetical protein